MNIRFWYLHMKASVAVERAGSGASLPSTKPQLDLRVSTPQLYLPAGAAGYLKGKVLLWECHACTREMRSSVSSLTSVLCVLYTSVTVSHSVASDMSLVLCVLGGVVWTASQGCGGVTWCPAGEGGAPWGARAVPLVPAAEGPTCREAVGREALRAW